MQHSYKQDALFDSTRSDRVEYTDESNYLPNETLGSTSMQIQNKLNCHLTSSFYYNSNHQLQEQNYNEHKYVHHPQQLKIDKMSYNVPANFQNHSYTLNPDAPFYHQDLIYSQNIQPQTKKVPFQYNEDMQNKNFQQMQADKQAATHDPKLQRVQEALKAYHEMDVEDDSEDEGIEDYKLGGYHPVHVGETLHKRYVTVQKLGWGHFSTVWLCKDFKYDTYVAVKIQKSAEHYIEAAYDEVEILQKVANKVNDQQWMESLLTYKKEKTFNQLTQNDAHVVQLLNSFVHKAPYGSHFCMVFEILGVNLLEIIKRYEFKGVPLNLCKKIAKQTLIGLDFLHRVCGVIHTDLKPENVLLQLSQEEISQIIDNGQLNKTQIFNDRLELYHDMFQIPRKQESVQERLVQERLVQERLVQERLVQERLVREILVIEQEERQSLVIQQTKLTKTQQKNLKKRISKKKKKEELDVIQQVTVSMNDIETQSTNQGTQQEDSNSVVDYMTEQQIYKDLFSLNREKISFKSKGKLPTDFQIKVADLGNACWTHHHFSTLIQTRQYRSPETIIGATYNQSADIWSFACMLFELLTGDFLFEPRKGAHFSKNDDHLAQIQELVGKFPLKYSQSCAKAKRYFSKNGCLKRIPVMNCWSLKNVLIEKYKFKLEEASELASFFQNMLNPLPEKRVKANEQLNHKWLQVVGEDNYSGKMTEDDFKSWQVQKENLIQNGQYLPHPRDKLQESEEDDGDASNQGTPFKRTANWRHFRGMRTKPNVMPRVADMATIDRSFTDLGYIGFETGIDTEQLDQASNQQFIC